jgi:cob(I)alamin adenosyltransferase
MKIYTKTGDAGSTSLVGGTRVSKCSARVNGYGDVDELISHIGLLRCELDQSFDAELRRIQEDLMLGAAHLASDVNVNKVAPFDMEEILFLEKRIDEMTSSIPEQKAFILPSRPRNASLCHIARTVCRRAERSSVAIADSSEGILLTIKFLNRLSDYLFTLGRVQNHILNISEDYWLP